MSAFQAVRAMRVMSKQMLPRVAVPLSAGRIVACRATPQMVGQDFSCPKGARSCSSVTKMLSDTTVSMKALEVLSENSFDSILMTDAAEGNITYANIAFTRLTGHTATSVIGKSPKILQGEGTDKRVIDRLAEALKTGGEFEGKAINYKKDGTPFIMYWRVVPVKVGGETKAWMAIQREGSHI